jgi:hypothetical protein
MHYHIAHMRVGGPGPQASSAIPSHLLNSIPLLPSIILFPFPSSHPLILVFIRVSSSCPILLLSSHHLPLTIRHPSRCYAHTHRPSPTPDPPSSSSSSSSPTPSHFRSFTNLARYATISTVSAPVAQISEGGSENPYCRKEDVSLNFEGNEVDQMRVDER